MIASGHPAVSHAGAEILRAGGNAFDACVAAGFASTIAEPALNSLGGGGFLLAVESTGGSTLFDFFVDTPGRGRTQSSLAPQFIPVTIHFSASQQVFNVGRGSIAVPGTLKGLLHVHEKLGRLPLRDVLVPGIALARNGVIVNAAQRYFLQILYPILRLGKQSRQLYTRGTEPIATGDRLRNPGLADFLETLHLDRGENFYAGELAAEIETAIGSDGNLTAEDLAGYRVEERAPLQTSYRGHEVLTNPQPALGGSLLALCLELLEQEPLGEIEWGSEAHLSLLIEVQIEADRRRRSSAPPRSATRGTTHLCVADAAGNVASMTASNGEGSGFVAPATGIMLNNMLGEDDLHPDGFHADPPGLRVSSMMSPSLVMRGGKPSLALGSGGSKRIRGAILQVMTQVLDFKRELQCAVDAPRLHWDGSQLQVEPGYSEGTLAALGRRWPVNLWQQIEVYFGGVQALEPGVSGAADPRRGGSVEVVV